MQKVNNLSIRQLIIRSECEKPFPCKVLNKGGNLGSQYEKKMIPSQLSNYMIPWDKLPSYIDASRKFYS